MNTIKEEVELWMSSWAPKYELAREAFDNEFRELLTAIFDDIESRAEANMLKTHKLEGMHYAALKDVRKELGV